jgi:hypothetical protein
MRDRMARMAVRAPAPFTPLLRPGLECTHEGGLDQGVGRQKTAAERAHRTDAVIETKPNCVAAALDRKTSRRDRRFYLCAIRRGHGKFA